MTNSRSSGYRADVSEAVSKAVLVTGCSTGIGRATAERLARRGWTVYASARQRESIKDLADAGCKLLTPSRWHRGAFTSPGAYADSLH